MTGRPRARLGARCPDERALICIYSPPDVSSVLIVGHEPQISSFIASICGGGKVALDKAGVAEVRLDHAHDPPGVLVWLTQPDRLTS